MKDEKLEQEFEEYFQGINTPDNITADAKKYVKRKSRFMPQFLKFASVAASFVLVFALSLVFFFNRQKSDGNEYDRPTAPSAVGVYGDERLTAKSADAYTVATIEPSLKIIQNLAYSYYSSVTGCNAYYMDEELALVSADVTLISNSHRHESTIYVEFAEEVYSPLKEYLDGAEKHYKGLTYFITEQFAENGEPLFKLYVIKDGVKYYFNITSSDESAYTKYLDMLI